jgi:two-component system response regulator AtoC
LLVVDDEPELMAALCDAFREEGYETTGFTDPAAAMTALRASGFDLLLSDMMMPETNGIQLLRQATEIDPQLVGIIMTGQGSNQATAEAMRVGASDIILKPFRIKQVLPILDRAMGIRRMRVENAQLKREVERLEAERVRLLKEVNVRLTR